LGFETWGVDVQHEKPKESHRKKEVGMKSRKLKINQNTEEEREMHIITICVNQ